MWKIIFVECRPVGGQWGVHRDPNAIAVQGTLEIDLRLVLIEGKQCKLSCELGQKIVKL